MFFTVCLCVRLKLCVSFFLYFATITYLLYIQDRPQFRLDFEVPIKRGMSSKASTTAILLGRERSSALHTLLQRCMLSRSKEELVGEEKLRGKKDHIVLCDLSPLQVDVDVGIGIGI